MITKTFTIIFISLFIILTISFSTSYFYNNHSIEIVNSIESLEKYALADNYENAEFELSKINNLWSNSKTNWAMFTEHFEIDNIDSTLTELEQFLYTKNKSDTIAKASLLKNYITHISNKEKYSIENIL